MTTKHRIYELARDFNMTNKDFIEKLQSMEIPVKSHMSSLDDETIARVKEALSGKKPSELEEKRIKPTVIRRRRKKGADQSVTLETAPESEEEPEQPPAVDEQPEPSPEVTELAVEPAPAAEAAVPETAEPEKMPEPVETQPAETAAKETEEVDMAPAQKKPQEGPPPVAVKPAKKVKKETPAKIIKLPTPAKGVPEAEKPAERPAGRKGAKIEPLRVSLETGPPAEEAETKDTKKKTRKKRFDDTDQDKKFFKKKISFRKKEIVEGADLYSAAPLRGRKGRKAAKAKAVPKGQKTQITTAKAIKRRIKIDDTIVLSDLAKRMGIKANEMIAKLLGMGVMATVNQTIDFETATLVAAEFEYELEKATFAEETIIKLEEDDPEKLVYRPPVVTIMGHVDHGKTSLLDVIRKTRITEIEAGGITQHIGAYHVATDRGQIVFLDTPGHEAFSAMRSRGAKITDIVVLVVAADDGVMPQTIEAVNHAKAAGVPIIVAVNKIDKANAEPDRVQRQLAEIGLSPEDWGGDTIFVKVSAKQNLGIDELLEMILLQSEILELKANPEKRASGHVVEAKLESGRGPVATVLIQEGTLHAGDPVVCGVHYGKVRALLNDRGKQVKSAGPSIPVEIIGLTGVPLAGDEMVSLADEKDAKQVSMHRMQKQRSKDLARTNRLSLEKLFEKMQVGEVKDLNLIIKADVHGSVEALKDSLIKLANEEVNINIVHAATGAISESDISLAAVSNAIIIGFNVRPNAKVQDMAAEENVDIRYHNIIYNVIKEVTDAIVGMMSSTFEERTLGWADVRETFHVPKIGTIAGCYVTEGKIERGQFVRLLRDGIVSFEGKIGSLRRFKDDVKEVQSGYECGIGIENFNDIKVGDTLECYYVEEIKPEL
jgi:translation initiation factor IF-2